MSEAPIVEGISADYAPSEETYIGDSGVFKNVGAGVAIHVGKKVGGKAERSTYIIEPEEAISFAVLLTRLAYRAIRENRRLRKEAKQNGQRS